MHKLRALNLPRHRGRDFFATVFVEPDPEGFDSFDPATDAEQWGISVHFQPEDPYASHVEIARIDTEHGDPDQGTDWLGQGTYMPRLAPVITAVSAGMTVIEDCEVSGFDSASKCSSTSVPIPSGGARLWRNSMRISRRRLQQTG